MERRTNEQLMMWSDLVDALIEGFEQEVVDGAGTPKFLLYFIGMEKATRMFTFESESDLDTAHAIFRAKEYVDFYMAFERDFYMNEMPLRSTARQIEGLLFDVLDEYDALLPDIYNGGSIEDYDNILWKQALQKRKIEDAFSEDVLAEAEQKVNARRTRWEI